MSEEHVHVATGAYALNAVPDDERETVEVHLREMPVVRAGGTGVDRHRGQSAGGRRRHAPPGMKNQVLARIQEVPQLPPQVTTNDASHHLPTARTRKMPRGTAVWQFQEAQQAEQHAQQGAEQTADMARVLAASDVRSATGSIKGGARAAVIVSRSQNSAVFLASGLPELPRDQTHQLWFADDGTMRPAGLIRHDGGLVMEGEVGMATGMGVTVESSGGSSQPTTTPLTLITLPT